MKLDVHNRQGETVGSVEVDTSIFGEEINKQLLHDVVVMHLANQRTGTHCTKRRGEKAGSTKKLFRQKGTGNARVGTRRTNKRRGGGTAKGPKPRNYYYRLPKKAVRKATKMAILSRFQDEEVVVIDELGLDEIRTKSVIEVLGNLKLDGQTCLIGTDDYDMTLYKSARNIPGVSVQPVSQWCTYEILRPKKVLLTKAALEALQKKANGTDSSEE